MKLKPVAFGLTAGILWGLAIFLTTWWLMMTGSHGHTIAKLGNVYLGYTFSLPGSFIGLVWGFADGFIGGFLFAWIYNKLAKEKEEAPAPAGDS